MESTESSGERWLRASTRMTRFCPFLAANLNQSDFAPPSRTPCMAHGIAGACAAEPASRLPPLSLMDSSGETVIQCGDGADRPSLAGKIGNRSLAAGGSVID